MEVDTPESVDCPGRRQLVPVLCGLDTEVQIEDIFEEDDFSWIVPKSPEATNKEICKDEDPSSVVLDVDDNQVVGCYCQAQPFHVPRRFTPCCLPRGVVLASREIQMLEVFRENLLGTSGSPPKTQTMRKWCSARAHEHYQSYILGKWVRVWRGQGHNSTIGWLLYTSWDRLMVKNITKEDCVREGRPQLTPKKFVKKFFPELPPTFQLYRVCFMFRKCTMCK